jgi:Asp-tRNA(Asn)/Glu-tRNA(Gln) amidotransferase A subunit family amidase
MSAEGVFPFSQTIDQMGLFTQDVGSALLAASVLVKDWDATVRGVSKPSIFMPADAFLVQADYDAFNRFYELVDKLTDRGYEVINYPLFKDIKKINRIHRDLITAEFARNHKELYKQYGDLYAETSAELVKKGSRISKAALEEAKAQQRYYIAQVQEIMENEGVDVWICPSTTSEAPKGLASTGNPIMNLPWTFTGLPSITLPLSRSTHNLPLGLQVISGPGKDEQLLQYAGEFVRALSY